MRVRAPSKAGCSRKQLHDDDTILHHVENKVCHHVDHLTAKLECTVGMMPAAVDGDDGYAAAAAAAAIATVVPAVAPCLPFL
jgi:hypothetical protein